MTVSAETAYEAHDWEGVLDALGGREDLSPDDQVLKGDALYWMGEYEASTQVFEQAFKALTSQGRRSEAGKVACLLAYLAFRRQAMAVSSGWISRAEDLLEGEPTSIAHLWLRIFHMAQTLFVEGDVSAAADLAREVLDVATEVGSRSGESLAKSFQATAMVGTGRWKEAMGIIDEATVMAMSLGEDLRMNSDVYCNTISLCRNLGDYRRAGEWTEEAERWMKANSVTAYTGACAVHRAELKLLRGSWSEAEDEARRACAGLEQFHLADYVGLGRYQIGEIRRRMGDLDGAEKSFEIAYQNFNDAQPGISLLMADRGDVEGAYESITAAMARIGREADNPAARGPSRARLLPALIEIALEHGDLELASSSVEDLEEIAGIYESEVWKAASTSARGALQLKSGDASAAIESLERAWRMWAAVDLPFEMGRARATLGEARRSAGDEPGARMEFKAALSTLEGLGARTEAEKIRLLLGEDEHGDTGATRVTRTFVFTDIETSTDLVELIGDEAWRDLLGWHDRTLRSVISAAGGEEVAHTGDGFFAAFEGARYAVEASVDIQRRLVRHRREAGFAPRVRIGVHTAEATRQGGNYHGAGVHVAARVGALAAGEQIVISNEVVEAAGALPYPLGEPRSVALKGVSSPVEVLEVDWR